MNHGIKTSTIVLDLTVEERKQALKQVQSQIDEAERRLREKEESEKAVVLGGATLEDIEKEIAEKKQVVQQLAQARAALSEAVSQKDLIVKQTIDKKGELDKLEAESNFWKSQIKEAANLVEEHKAKANVIQEQMQDKVNNLDTIKKSIHAHGEELERLKVEIVGKKHEVKSLEEEINSLVELKKKLQQETSLASDVKARAEKEVEKVKALHALEVKNHNDKLGALYASMEDEKAEFKLEMERREGDVSEKEQLLKEKETYLRAYHKELEKHFNKKFTFFV